MFHTAISDSLHLNAKLNFKSGGKPVGFGTTRIWKIGKGKEVGVDLEMVSKRGQCQPIWIWFMWIGVHMLCEGRFMVCSFTTKYDASQLRSHTILGCQYKPVTFNWRSKCVAGGQNGGWDCGIKIKIHKWQTPPSSPHIYGGPDISYLASNFR